jgi:uncharacterized MAPEG superfamily protein
MRRKLAAPSRISSPKWFFYGLNFPHELAAADRPSPFALGINCSEHVVLVLARTSVEADRIAAANRGTSYQEAKMTTDIRYLIYTSVLTATLWIPYIICQVMTNGPLQPKDYVDPALPRPVPAWGQRAHRAYLNATEVFAPFAALVIVTQLLGKANAMTAFWSASFFYLRLAHAIVYWAGLPYLRTILFTLAFVAELGIFWEAIK